MEPLNTAVGLLLSDRILLTLLILVLSLLILALLFVAFTFILRFRSEREARIWSELKERWEPLLMEVLSDPQRMSELHEAVGPGEHLRFLEFVLQYAQRVGGTERDILQEAASPYLKEILPHLEHRNMGVRARAVQTIGTLGLPALSTEVRRAIEDPAPFVAALAARLLAHEVGAEIAPELCRSLPRFHMFRIWYLVDLLVALGPSAIPVIRSTMEDVGALTRTRAVAAHALAALRDLEGADSAARLATTESDPELLSALLRLLAQVGTAKHAEAARRHLSSQEFFVRAAATRTLAELGLDSDLPLLMEALDDPSAWVRMAAARGIYRLGGKAAMTALIQPQDPATPLFRQVLAEEGGR